MSEPQYPDTRCTAAILVEIPDEAGIRDARTICQCEKHSGHGGKHKAEPTLLWQSPRR